jgi:uncharacterized membrane protein
MEKMLVVIFENELKAYDGFKALKELDSEGSISLHSEAVIKKNADKTITVKQEDDDFPIRTIGGTAVGALIGLLGGPIGFAAGAVVGTFAGSIWDMNRAGVNADFLDEVSDKLTAGKWAVVADASEDWVTPIDARMAALGGTVFRNTRRNVEKDQYDRDVAAIKEDIAELKAEQAKSSADQKAKLQAKIDNLNMKLQAKQEQMKQWEKQQEEETKVKIASLEKKQAKAKGDTKAKIDARIAKMKDKQKRISEDMKKLKEDLTH